MGPLTGSARVKLWISAHRAWPEEDKSSTRGYYLYQEGWRAVIHGPGRAFLGWLSWTCITLSTPAFLVQSSLLVRACAIARRTPKRGN